MLGGSTDISHAVSTGSGLIDAPYFELRNDEVGCAISISSTFFQSIRGVVARNG